MNTLTEIIRWVQILAGIAGTVAGIFSGSFLPALVGIPLAATAWFRMGCLYGSCNFEPGSQKSTENEPSE